MFRERVLGILLLVLSLSFALACSGQSKEKIPLEVGLGASASANTELLNRYQPDVRMTAFWEEGAVRVQVQNRTNKRIEVGPDMFAVIIPTSKTGGQRRPIPVEPGKVGLDFPVTQLDPDGVASGQFRFRELGNLEGCNLAFKSNDPTVRPSVCRIESKKAPAPDATDAPTDEPEQSN